MKLIAGLGNSGKKYEKTRHNAGFMAVDYLAKHFNFDDFKKSGKHNAEIAEGQINGEKVLIIKPQTYVNLSGNAIASVMNFYKIPTENLIVIFDDADLPYGTLRVREKGSSGGHNGIKSIIEKLGTDIFTRIKIGIMPPSDFPAPLEAYVLGELNKEEKVSVDEVIKKLPEVVEDIIK